MSWVATAIAGAGLLGAGASIYGSQKASSTQQAAAQQATNAQLSMFNQGAGAVSSAQGGIGPAVGGGQDQIMQAIMRMMQSTGQGQGQILGAMGNAGGLLSPYAAMGAGAIPGFQAALPDLTAKFNPSDLSNTPGYKFTLDQGLKATTNANSAMGLADSGVQGKGIANYAEGLASTTYQQQQQNYLQQQQQRYNMLAGPIGVGEGAAGTLGSLGLSGASAYGNLGLGGAGLGLSGAQAFGQLGLGGAQSILGGAESLLGGGINTGQGIGSNIMGGANASAAATMTGANAIGGLGTNAMNQYMQYLLMSRLTGGGAGAGNGNFLNSGFGNGGYNFLDAQATG